MSLPKPYYEDPFVTIHQGDARNVLASLPKESVQCVVTSPPYWGLRKYAGEQDLVWGANHCEHTWAQRPEQFHKGQVPDQRRKTQVTVAEAGQSQAGASCSLCGAWKGAYGLEPSPSMYVDHTIEMLRAIRRVLRSDGVVLWTIGDSYATHASGGKDYAHNFRAPDVAIREGIDQPKPTAKSIGLKPKDLCLIPFRVALAVQADGWWVRSVIIWSKSNPMPESVKDRPTESHEYILMLTKSAKYYWDQDAAKEPSCRLGEVGSLGGAKGRNHHTPDDDPNYRGGHEQWGRDILTAAGRNIRTVWEFPTTPYPSAHFATFPTELPKKCIMAATSEKGNCSECGKPWVRITNKGFTDHGGATESTYPKGSTANRLALLRQSARSQGKEYTNETETLGWQAQCSCNAEPKPAVILDPFAGSGTVGAVAKSLGRKAILIDISSDYCRLAKERVEGVPLPMVMPL